MENNINFDKEMRRIYNAALSALMDAAMPVMITRQYLNFRLRKDDGKWEPITLNFSRL